MDGQFRGYLLTTDQQSIFVLTELGYTQDKKKKSSSQVVRAYDNARRDVLGTIGLLIEYGPIARTLEFMVIDIEACFNFLLGRPWIHENQAVPSTLHQQVKILTKHDIVTIKGDPEIMSIHPATESVLQLDEELGTRLDGFNVCGYLNAGSDSEWVGVSNEEEPEIELILKKMKKRIQKMILHNLGRCLWWHIFHLFVQS